MEAFGNVMCDKTCEDPRKDAFAEWPYILGLLNAWCVAHCSLDIHLMLISVISNSSCQSTRNEFRLLGIRVPGAVPCLSHVAVVGSVLFEYQ